METLSFAEKTKRFIETFKPIDLLKEYGEDWNGAEKWAIVTNLPESEILPIYSDVLELFKPYMILTEEVGSTILEFNRVWENQERNKRRHNLSLDSFAFEGIDIGTTDTYLFENDDQFDIAISHLNSKQLSRLEKYASGMSYQQIADEEGMNVKSVYECIEGARKKFLKFFLKNPQ